MSRSFGDEVASSVGVTCEPEILDHTLHQEDKILILGSDGVWEFMSNEEVMRMALLYYEDKNPEKAGDLIVEECAKRWKE